MALTGLQIYKMLPQTNCKECGFPTCLAFAMKLAQKGTELSNCPYVSEETKVALDAAAAPPIRLVGVGLGEHAFAVGNEVALFRHEKAFYNPTALIVRVSSEHPQVVDLTARAVFSHAVERAGIRMRLGGLAIEDAGKGAVAFAAAVAAARKAEPGLPLVLMSEDLAAMEAALAEAGSERPLIYAATRDNLAAMAGLAKQHGCPLVVRDGDGDLEALAELTAGAQQAGVDDIVLDPGTTSPAAALAAFTQLRRLALKKNLRALGFPIIAFATGTPAEQAIAASAAIAKYAGIVVLDGLDFALVYALATLRLNLYTDPQKPIQMEPKLYEIGKAGVQSPLLVTTNFSLTYFTVVGEIESSGVPVWLLVTDADGMSVLTAWAAGKFDADKIAKSVNSSGVGDKIRHRKLVLPGYVAGLSGEVEEELPGWEAMVGPREAVEIPSYLKNAWSAE